MESSFSYTFADLKADVLSYQGQSRDTEDETAIAKAARRVNDAYRKFLALDWGFLSKQAAMTVEAGKDTYELPDDYGVMRVPFKAFPNTAYINPVEETVSKIWNCRMYYPQSGTPLFFTFLDEYSVQRGLRKKVVFFPSPPQTIQYNYEYRVFAEELSDDADIPYCPPNLSHVLREFCLAEVELFDQEGSNSAHTTQLYRVLLPQAIRENSIRKPSTVGSMIPQTGYFSLGTRGTVYGTIFQY